MILPIDDKYRLKSDAYCWHVQIYKGIPTSGVMKGKEYWKSIRWYQKLPEALNGLAELEVMTSQGTSLVEALDAVRDVSERLSMALTPHIEILGE